MSSPTPPPMDATADPLSEPRDPLMDPLSADPLSSQSVTSPLEESTVSSELFVSAVQQQPYQEQEIGLDNDSNEDESSGYATAAATHLPHSDTLDDVTLSPEPEPEKEKNSLVDDNDVVDIPLDDDNEAQVKEENPFQDPHLNQFGGGHGVSPTPVLPPLMAAAPLISEVKVGDGGVMVASPGTILDGMDNAGEEFIRIKVTKPHKVGDGMSSYIAYKIITTTNISYFRRRESTVIRRFSDFLGLHDKLSEKYLPNGRVIPPAPDKSVVGMTKVKMGKDGATTENGGTANDSSVPDEFLERRRAALERFLARTAGHPSLRADPDFRDFLEFDGELPRSSQTAALSSKNMMKLIGKVSDKVTSMTIKMDETDEWFEEKGRTIDELDAQLRRLHHSAESLFEFRRALSGATGSLARALNVLSHCEDNSELAGALSTLGGVQERVERIHGEQASADFFLLSELIKDYIGLVAAVKDVFQERVKAWQQWQNATQGLTRKREAKVKAELQHRPERAGQLRQEIADMERQQEMAQENFEKISRLIKKEVEMFDLKKTQDFKDNIIAYLQSMLKAQEGISQTWEQYLPEIRQVNGGENVKV